MATIAKTKTKATRTAARAAPRAAKARANAAPRDSHGRFKADHNVRNAAFAATAVVGVAAVGLAAAFKFGLLDRFLPELDGHEGSDAYLIRSDDVDWHGEGPPSLHRAPRAFRGDDLDAPLGGALGGALNGTLTEEQRETLRTPPKGARAGRLIDAEDVV